MGTLIQMVMPVVAFILLTGIIGKTNSQTPTEEPLPKRVPVPPLISGDPPKTLAFRERDSFKLKCEATGDPEPTYKWQFNSEDFDPSGLDGRVNIQPGSGTLIFNEPLTRDEGLYQCFATNKYGTAASVKVVLRKGDLQAFTNTDTKYHRPKIGSSLTLICNPPVSYPPARISWTRVGGMETGPIEFNGRVSMDPVGDLNFANILPEDSLDGASYGCEIWNDVMRRQQKGSFNIIQPQGGVPERHPPAVMWTDPTNQIALRGETFRVKCIFAGNPTPRVTWNRAGGKPMPPRKSEASYGQELVISQVQYEDEGGYECEGINQETQTPLRKSFNLVIKSAPYWVVKPESWSAAETESARFECKADGRPSPVIDWFINGVPISKIPDDPRRKVEGGVITFTNLTIDDAMVYQCNASNVHGYIYANAFLNVQSEPPTILDPPKEQKAAEGKTVEMSCRVYGSPKPSIVWSKGNEQLTGGNFRVLGNGSLLIQEVSLVDAGDYTCTATNKWDTTSSTATLVVRRKTRIQTGPLDVMIYENTEVKFTCTATTDPEEIQNLKIIWKKNRQIIDFQLAQRMFQNDLDNSLTISGTMSLDTAAYSCMATNGLDEDEITAQLIVQGVPDPPEKIKINCTENSVPAYAIIDWQPAKENYAPILNFIIQYNTSFAPDQWVNIRDNISQTARSIQIELSPWVNYTFRVLARNKIGLSDPGVISSQVCRTKEGLPTKNPDNVIGEGDEPDNLVIFWTPIAPIDQNGETFTYIISWKRLDQPDAIAKTHTIEGAPYYHHIVPDTQPTYVPFEITVMSQNGVGKGPVPTPIIGYSGEDIPTLKVTGIKVVPGSLTGRTVTLEWPPIEGNPTTQIRGFFRGYRVQYWLKDGDDDYSREVDHIVEKPKNYPRPRPRRSLWDVETTTPIPVVRVTLTNLRPYSTILIHVRILNKYYAGPLSDPPLQVQTPEGEPGPPRDLDAVSKGPTHFDLRWEAPVQTNGILLGYNISYQTITGLNLGRLQYREEGVLPNATSARLTALKPNMYYRVFLSARTKAGKGEPMFMDAQTTPAGAPNPPTFSFVGDVGENYVDIKWTPSHGNNPGSVFYVQYRERGAFEWIHSRDVALHFSIRIDGLDPGKTYQMRVVAKNGQGLQSHAEWQEVTTAGIPPGGIEVGRSLWFYMLFLSLVVLALILVGFMFCKRYRDSWWEEEERNREIQMLAHMEKLKQMELDNQMASRGSQENMDPGVGYEDSDEESDDDTDLKPAVGKSMEEEAPPLPVKKSAQGYVNPDLPPPQSMAAADVPQASEAQPYAANPEYGYPEGYDYSQYPEGSYPEGTYPEGYYPEGAYPEGYHDEHGQYHPYDYSQYPEYDDGQYYTADGQYYGADGQYYTADGQYQPQDQQQVPGVHVRDGQLHLETDPRSGGSSAI